MGVLDRVGDTVAARLSRVFSQDSLASDVLSGLRGTYTGFLIPSFGLFLLALSLTLLAAPRGHSAIPDGREWSGRAFAVLTISAIFCFKTLTLFGYYQGGMGGGMEPLVPGG